MSSKESVERAAADEAPPAKKCVVWDLDDTLWEGVLLEGQGQKLRRGVLELIRALDERGILQSIASRNDHEQAMERLRELGLAEYFLYPQIGWNPKSAAIREIATSLNIGIDAIAFVDDQAFERDEVHHALPKVMCIDAAAIYTLLELPELMPRFVTEDSRRRRQMYLGDITRNKLEASYTGTPQEFLASLDMRMVIAPADADDLQRAEELTLRTNQLNTTGYTYSYEELDGFRSSPDHELLIASLEDKYGTYGKIGLALTERQSGVFVCKLLLMSCRVMARGVGTVMINHLMASARDAGVRFQAEFVETDRNRQMYITYKLLGFREVSRAEKRLVLEADLKKIQPFPPFMKLEIIKRGG